MEAPTQNEKKVRFLVNIAYLAAILAIIYLVFKYLLNLLMPIFLALIFAAIVRPISRFLSRETKYVKNVNGEKIEMRRRFHMNKNVAGIISVVVLFLVVGGILTLVFVRLIDTISDLVSAVPRLYENSLLPALNRIYRDILVFAGRFDDSVLQAVESSVPNLISSLGSAVTNISGKLVGWITSLAGRLPNILLNTVICLIATVFIAVDFDRIKAFIRRNLPEKPRLMVMNVRDSFLDMIWQFLKSYFIIFCITTTEITIGLLLIGGSKPLLIGILIAIFDAFPVVGSGMILLPWAVVTLIMGKTVRGLCLGVLYAVVVIARQIIEPKIVGKHVGLRPIVTLSCMYAGTKLFGGVGLFGVPIAAAILVDLNDNGIIHWFSRSDESNASDKKHKGEKTK